MDYYIDLYFSKKINILNIIIYQTWKAVKTTYLKTYF